MTPESTIPKATTPKATTPKATRSSTKRGAAVSPFEYAPAPESRAVVEIADHYGPVSYTHLTLPTNREV